MDHMRQMTSQMDSMFAGKGGMSRMDQMGNMDMGKMMELGKGGPVQSYSSSYSYSNDGKNPPKVVEHESSFRGAPGQVTGDEN